MYKAKIASLVTIASEPTTYDTQVTTSQPRPKPLAIASGIFGPYSYTSFTTLSTTVYTTGKMSLQRPLGPERPTLSRTGTLPYISMVVAVMLLGMRQVYTVPSSVFFFAQHLQMFILQTVRWLPPLLLFLFTYCYFKQTFADANVVFYVLSTG